MLSSNHNSPEANTDLVNYLLNLSEPARVHFNYGTVQLVEHGQLKAIQHLVCNKEAC